MSDHNVHEFDASNGVHVCKVCGRDAIVCPDCQRCTVCLHADPATDPNMRAILGTITQDGLPPIETAD